MALKVFIADDEADLVELYTDALELYGHTVVGVAYDGAEAVEKFYALNERPDVVIMDHRMPVKSGLEATKEILEIEPGAKVVFASADGSVENEARSMGAVSFKKKPFSLERLASNLLKIEAANKNTDSLSPAKQPTR